MRIGTTVFGCAAGRSKGAGISVYLRNLIKNLAKLDKKNTYYIFMSKNNKNMFLDINQKNFNFVVFPFVENGFTRLFFDQFILPLLTVLYRINIIHFPISRASLLCFKRALVTVHDLMYKYYAEHIPGCMSSFKIKYFDFNLKIVLRKVVKIIADSNYTAQEIQRYFDIPLNKIKVIHMGVDDRLFNSDFKEDLDMIKKGEKYILTVKSNLPHKNLKGVVKGFAIAKTKYRIPHKLIIVGSAKILHDELLESIQELTIEEDILFVENVTDKELSELYKRADLFIFLPLNEGFGMPILEAMASGVPVLCSDRASLPEVSGDAAMLIDPLDVNQVGEMINRCLNDEKLRKDMISKGIQRASLFSWETTAKETLMVYQSI